MHNWLVCLFHVQPVQLDCYSTISCFQFSHWRCTRSNPSYVFPFFLCSRALSFADLFIFLSPPITLSVEKQMCKVQGRAPHFLLTWLSRLARRSRGDSSSLDKMDNKMRLVGSARRQLSTRSLEYRLGDTLYLRLPPPPPPSSLWGFVFPHLSGPALLHGSGEPHAFLLPSGE